VLTRSQRRGPPEGKVKFTIQGQRMNLFEVQLKPAEIEMNLVKFFMQVWLKVAGNRIS
jgi:hypothetical protein